jgi:hypothetical protein
MTSDSRRESEKPRLGGKLKVSGATNVARGPRCVGRRDGISGNSSWSSLLRYGAVISQSVRWSA